MSEAINSSQGDGGVAVNEYEREPVPENKTKGLGSFLGLFASEHVAATELVIGPLFVAHGVSPFDLLVGLLVGNLLAVLSWRFLTAPIAVKRRLTFYYQLEKIGGSGIIDVYNVANGLLWCCLAAAFIYVSATALFGPLNINVPESAWAPTSITMVGVIMAMGAVIAVVAAKGYDAVVRFANIAAPWMVLMFIVIGIAALPELGVKSPGDFWRVANEVWTGQAEAGRAQFTFWHVVFFAWFGNMAWHVGMGDLTVFRYARKARYGWAAAAGMYLGHYIAWITAGLIFAVQFNATGNRSISPGPMAQGVVGVTGILLVLFAGWTTANPVIYRAGLAFQSIRPKWSRVKVTLVAGAIASVIAVFPLCNQFLGIAMLYGVVLMPMGAVIVVDHYLMRRMGMTEFYAERAGKRFHWPPLLAWALSLVICLTLWLCGVHAVFLCLPGWLLSGVVYLVASKYMQKAVTVKGEEA
jgi:purine-cytosine permease-like protein